MICPDEGGSPVYKPENAVSVCSMQPEGSQGQVEEEGKRQPPRWKRRGDQPDGPCLLTNPDGAQAFCNAFESPCGFSQVIIP